MEQPRGIQYTLMQTLEDVDLCLFSRMVGHMQANTTRLCNIARTAGLEINVTKTKSMRISASHEAPLSLSMARPSRKFIATPTWAAM